jgi:hypothetical protein
MVIKGSNKLSLKVLPVFWWTHQEGTPNEIQRMEGKHGMTILVVGLIKLGCLGIDWASR